MNVLFSGLINLSRICAFLVVFGLGAPVLAATTNINKTSPATTTPPQQADETNDMLAAASVSNGHTVSHPCTMCHSFDKGGPDEVGPNLFGIVGRKHASEPGYSYSFVLKKMKDRTWTVDALDQWLKQPAAYAPGTTMNFGGVLDPQDRMDLIAYLMTLK